MSETIISAGAGLIGAIIGGVATYLSVNKQLNFEREKINDEETKKIDTAVNIIKTFLASEIRHNYDVLNSFDNGAIMKVLTQKEHNERFGWNGLNLSFKEFDRIKYEIIKYNVDIIKNIFNTYKAFALIGTNNNYNKLSQKEKDFIKNVIVEYDEMIKNF